MHFLLVILRPAFCAVREVWLHANNSQCCWQQHRHHHHERRWLALMQERSANLAMLAVTMAMLIAAAVRRGR